MANSITTDVEIRKKKAVTLAYPAKADARGSARVNFCGKAYYFGPHNSLESFTLFGEWRRLMVEDGEAPEPKVLRLDLAHHQQEQDSEPVAKRSMSGRMLAVACVIILATSVYASARIFSSHGVASVDGKALTEDELAIVRGNRRYQDIRERNKLDPVSKAEQIAEIKEEIREIGLEEYAKRRRARRDS